ncbi:zeta toxin family protein [Brachybacterium sp. JHP9]|uniref:UDP-N-acetylglucosamine kinase n=1 Tax=Brachybacterium equifaecis TaxID=2910770 RepID=A0ABT0R2V7_9MICO|nr:zeta toxin family protein [Brachybacterium equifaecis]MCL6423574.1 zeta toxin family protein [Brachybacterium equifaecis]
MDDQVEHPVGSDEWLTRVFQARARQRLFGSHSPHPDGPVLVLLGGQPAAGKTQAQRTILAEHPDDDLVEVTGDDLRVFHPDYRNLSRDAPFLMPNTTAPVSGGLVRLAVEHAHAHRYSLLLEGTFRDPAMVTGTAGRFADAGYRVEVAAVATPAVVSRLSAEMRSLAGGLPAVGRWTPPSAHESALEHSPGVLAALETLPHVARVQVFSRERLLYANTRTSTGAWQRPAEAARVLHTEQHRALGEVEAVGWLRDYAAVFAQAAARPGYLGPETAPTYLRLQANAEGMIRSLMFTPGAPAGELQRQQRERHAHLRRVLPPDLIPTRRTARPAPFSEPPAHAPDREPPTRGL